MKPHQIPAFLDPDVQELHIILAEECAEVVQATTKMFRHGSDNYHPATMERNLPAVARELGHVMALRTLLTMRHGEAFMDAIEEARQDKLRELPRFLHGELIGTKTRESQ